DTLVPAESDKPYDIREIIHRVVDGSAFLEVQELFAKNLVVGFARLAGQSVGIVANQPAVLAGCLAINASVKGPRFFRFCGAVNIVYRRELQKAYDPAKLRAEKVEEFRRRFANPFVAAERGYIDAVIEPRDTRPKLIAALRMLENKRDTNPPKKHGNIPL